MALIRRRRLLRSERRASAGVLLRREEADAVLSHGIPRTMRRGVLRDDGVDAVSGPGVQPVDEASDLQLPPVRLPQE